MLCLIYKVFDCSRVFLVIPADNIASTINNVVLHLIHTIQYRHVRISPGCQQVPRSYPLGGTGLATRNLFFASKRNKTENDEKETEG